VSVYFWESFHMFCSLLSMWNQNCIRPRYYGSTDWSCCPYSWNVGSSLYESVTLLCQTSRSIHSPSASKSDVLSAELAMLSVCSLVMKASECVSNGGPCVPGQLKAYSWYKQSGCWVSWSSCHWQHVVVRAVKIVPCLVRAKMPEAFHFFYPLSLLKVFFCFW
jgi:hypothetical protein